jgi:hypothetical protein
MLLFLSSRESVPLRFSCLRASVGSHFVRLLAVFRSLNSQQVRPPANRQLFRYPFQTHRRLAPQSRRHPHLSFIPFRRTAQLLLRRSRFKIKMDKKLNREFHRDQFPTKQ